nr:uncharacterized protein At4g00950-like isoform X2 [Ipomoea batatas]
MEKKQRIRSVMEKKQPTPNIADLAVALHRRNQRREPLLNSAVGKKNRGNWKKTPSPPLLLEVGINGGSPELCTLPRTNAECRLLCSVLPDAITSEMESPEHPGMLTPPLHTAVSVPFRWEEQPGKPRPCTDLIALPPSVPDHAMFSGRPKCLDPPPRLYLEYSSCRNSGTAKSPSPTTVLDGPYITARPQFSSSFRFSSNRASPEKGQLRALVLGENKKKRSWWQRTLKFKGGSREIGASSFIFPSYNSMDAASDNDNGNNSSSKMARFTRTGSFSTLSPSRSHFWVRFPLPISSQIIALISHHKHYTHNTMNESTIV